MQSAPDASTRLTRLLVHVERDARNLVLRKDAIREAFDTGQWRIARELIDAGLQADPREADLLALSGFSHLQAQRYGNAEEALLAALACGLSAPDLHYNIAFADFMLKRYSDAAERLTPPDISQAVPLALTLRARCLHHLGHPIEAIADCEARLIATPDDADTHGLLGLLLYEVNDSVSAMKRLNAALTLNPRQLEALLALALLQSDAQDHDAARSSYELLLRAHPRCGRGWLGLALVELQHLQIGAAKLDIEIAAAHMPDHIGTWHVLAWIQIMQGDVQAAQASFERALALDRTFAETHGGMAVVAVLQGREADAGASIKRALRLTPESMSARYAEFLLLKRHGEDAAAQSVLDAFLASSVPPSDMRYRDLVAMHMQYLSARASGKPDGAVLH